MHDDLSNEEELLKTWEEVYKKGLLSFWMLMLLFERPSYPFEMKPLIEEISSGSITAEENSLYRALTRFEQVGIVESERKPSLQGPSRRYYHLTSKGIRLLSTFIERNLDVFLSDEVQSKIQTVRTVANSTEGNNDDR